MMRVRNILFFALIGAVAGLLVSQRSAQAQSIDNSFHDPSGTAANSSHAMTRKGRDAFKEIFKNSIVDAELMTPNDDQIAKFKDLIKMTLESSTLSPRLIQQWGRQGWECVPVADSNVVVVAEKSSQRWGRGIYAIRTGSRSRIVLQAPHRFNDAKTGVIARKIFEEHNVWAVAFNTVHRKELDLAHCQRHYFNAFTEAVVALRSNSLVLQLHGFSNATKTNAGKTASLIVSDTTKFPGRLARRAAEEFKFNFGKSHTRLYPIETRWLGGTENHQANLMQQLGSTGFLHFEMNPSFRQQLVSTASIREQFFTSIASSTRQ